ncbi:hypothetical protein QUC31_001552 [Theobroma cacao]
MQQKIVIKVNIHCEKCRTKALKIAATTHGVNEVAIKGKARDELTVIGNEVDSVKLACSLRKKLRNATIVSVEEKKEEKKDEKKYEYFPSYYAHYPQYLVSEVARDPYQPTCSIM